MKTLAVLLFLFGFNAHAFVVDQGNIDLSAVSVSRSSGYAPLVVFFDGSGITDAGKTTIPFLEMDCRWGFGDANSGSWGDGALGANGTGVAASRNASRGLVAAHVYETPGTYTASVSCTDGTNNTALKTFTITVSDPDGAGSPFLATNTVCIYNSTKGTGCPTGATEYVTSDLNLAISVNQGTNKRLLFKRGDTFAGSSASPSATGPAFIGAYGSGDRPKFIKSGTLTSGVILTFSSVATDWRIQDIEVTGPCVASCVTVGITATGTNTLLNRVYVHDVGSGITAAGSGVDAANVSGTGGIVALSADVAIGATHIPLTSLTNNAHTILEGWGVYVGSGTRAVGTVVGTPVSSPASVEIDIPLWSAFVSGTPVNFWKQPRELVAPPTVGMTVVNSTIERVWNTGGGVGMFVTSTNMFVAGNLVSDATRGEHVFRSQGMDHAVVQFNTMQWPGQAAAYGAAGSKYVFVIRAPDYWGGPTILPGTYSEYIVVSDNKFIGNDASAYIAGTMAQNQNSDERIRYLVFERNLLVAGTATTQAFTLFTANLSTLRNNVFDLTARAGAQAVIVGDGDNGPTQRPVAAAYNHIYNNTIHTTATWTVSTSVWSPISLGANSRGTNNILLKNNLVYAPNATGTVASVSVCTSSCSQNGAVGTAPTATTQTANSDASSIKTGNPNYVTVPPAGFLDYKPVCASPSTYPCGQGTDVPIWFDGAQLKHTSGRDLGAFAH